MAKTKNTIDLIDVNKTNKSKGKNIDKLLNMFRISPTDNGKIIPTEPVKDKNNKDTGKYKPIEMPSSIESAYQYLVQNLSTAPYMDNMYRFERYKDVQYMVSTEPIMNTAKNIYVNESFNPEDGKKTVEIHAKEKEVETCFYEWYNNVGFTDNTVRDALSNLVIFGDSFWINNIDLTGNNGVIGITPLDPFLVSDRIEFNVGMVNRKKQWSQWALNLCSNYNSLQQIYDIVTKDNLEDISQFYKSYLFGYTLKLDAEDEDGKDVKGVPPWAITHCRLFTTEKEFFPFGKSILFSALPSYKSYKTTQMLIDMLRCASFPREHITIKGEDNMDPFTRHNRVDQARQFIENITPQTQNQDGLSVGSKVYDMEGLCEWDLIDPSVDLDQLGDMEAKYQTMVMSTGIPDTLLIPSNGAGDLGGENAESLKYLNKIFQKRCESLRYAFLEGVTESFRMHLLLTGKFEGDKTEFELCMPNNIEDYTSDKVSEISDIFDLAKDIIDSIASCAGLERGESIDQSIVKDILRTYLPIESATIEKWISKIYKNAEEQKEENPNPEEEGGTPTENVIGKKGNFFDERKSLKEKINLIMNDKKHTIQQNYFKYKRENGLLEGAIGNKIYYNNSYRMEKDYKYSPLGLLKEEMQKYRVSKIQERVNNDEKEVVNN